MMTVWKFKLGLDRRQSVAMPVGSVPLNVQCQDGCACLWALVDPNAPQVLVPIELLGTGYEIDPALVRHLGTYQAGPFVWHVFGPAVWP